MFTDFRFRYFAEFSEESYARAGSIAEKTVKLPDGPLDVPGSLEPQLRSLGMPIKLENGIARFNTGYPLDAILLSDEALFSKHILHCRFYPAIIKLGK